MKGWSIFAGRLFGVELRIHTTFLLLLLFVLLTESYRPGGGGAGIPRGIALVSIIFASVVLHELGHAVVAKRTGVRVRGILLLPIGGLPLMDPQEHIESAKNPRRETLIAIAGPVVNALLAAISGVVFLGLKFRAPLWVQPLITSHALARSFFWTNVFLFAFNLLPAFPMDGGRVLRAWLARKMDFQQATQRAVKVGHAFAIGFMLLGAISTAWLMIIGLVIFVAAQMEERTVLFQSVVESVRMEDIMLTEFSTLSPADTLEDALDKAVHSLQDDFPVVRGSDLVGVINRQTILDKLRREGNGYIQGAMNKAFEIAARTESLASAFRKLTVRGLTLIPIVDQEHLVGIVTLQNLMHSMGLLAETRRLRRQAEEQVEEM
ncbi:MAG TPA: site-2 protease family protein [Candidatus Angelobacter sp.]|jgi:Zn-dependent protease|nr:site-2 protease family protein [Candidatus Angelobacter sp.]